MIEMIHYNVSDKLMRFVGVCCR